MTIPIQPYQTVRVFAPVWMQNFECLAGNCPNTCCQKWDIEVDPAHAVFYSGLNDAELSPLLDKVLLKMRLRRPHAHEEKNITRLNLTRQPQQHCTLLDNTGNCRLQKKYGATALCDTCYFFPRLFWQIEESFTMTASLSCPEAARLALCSETPTAFCHFENAIDPEAEWLEPSLIENESCRTLLLQRELIVTRLAELLQDRSRSIAERVSRCMAYLIGLGDHIETLTPHNFLTKEQRSLAMLPTCEVTQAGNLSEQVSIFLRAFRSVDADKARPIRAMSELLTHLISGGREVNELITANFFFEMEEHYLPFLAEHQYMEENWLVHFVFSETLKQFTCYQNESPDIKSVLQFEAALLQCNFSFFRILQCKNSMLSGKMDEAQFLRTAYEMDNNYLHYSGWLVDSIKHFCTDSPDDKDSNAFVQ